MKKFSFRLQRVLEWRDAQARLEEGRLGVLRAAVQASESAIAAIAQESEVASRQILTARSVSGEELAALGDHREQAIVRTMQLTLRRAEAQRAVDFQLKKVADRRREARLLERLRERRLSEWRHASDREIEHQAAENYLLRWNR